MRKFLASGAIALAALTAGAVAIAAESVVHPPHKHWHFQGPFGTYDRAAAQRGFQVYKDVCAACHSLSLLSYRNLTELGLTEDQVKGIAAEFQVPDLSDDGSPIERPARPSDRFKKPFPNALAAAAANGGKAPPDLSLIVKAREGGPDYIHGLLTGYVPFEKLTPEQVKEFAVTKDDNFNLYFPGHKIAMPPPLSDDKVTYVDGTKATVEQMSTDVTEFLAWASEPHLEARNRTGIRVVLFLLALAGLMYAVKRQVWADKH
ncbi:cytochrome c1 [Reyranella sp.]|jgi:ubiquinol-cytochrome c reductase cytochrome c1 subunit|uniref:cytochrome c1 n=1 Tax=Reyranella sp. TaxID=1929291 RepID=UPI003D0FAF6C